MKFQYVSDIHMEHGTELNITPQAPYLLLAGDIGYPYDPHYEAFLAHTAPKFLKVFLIMGNHEYWGYTLDDIHKRCAELETAISNLVILNNTAFELTPELSIYGTTLWSHISNETLVAKHVWDYRKIIDFTPKDASMIHQKARDTFKTLASKEPNRKWVILCHHIPHTSLIHESYNGNPLNEAYASNVEEFCATNVLAVVHGHTHKPHITGKYYCNPVGYPGQNTHDTNRTFEIDPRSLFV
jgi:predicted phosphohydrolase